MTSLTKRKIELVFRLGQGSFGESGANTLTVTDARVQCSISNTSGPGLGEARLRIYGLVPSTMRALSSLNAGTNATRMNALNVSAGDDVNGLALVFSGQIALCQIDMNSAPEVALVIVAQAGLFSLVKRANPTTYPGSADAAVILQNLAQQAGFEFENNGVSVILQRPYFKGSVGEQIRACIEQAGIDRYIGPISSNSRVNILAIWPKGGTRAGLVPLISAQTGMVGYPAYASGGPFNGLAVRCLFNPLLRLGGRAQVQVEANSPLTLANGTWQIFDLGHDLESETPDGEWFTHFTGVPVNA